MTAQSNGDCCKVLSAVIQATFAPDAKVPSITSPVIPSVCALISRSFASLTRPLRIDVATAKHEAYTKKRIRLDNFFANHNRNWKAKKGPDVNPNG